MISSFDIFNITERKLTQEEEKEVQKTYQEFLNLPGWIKNMIAKRVYSFINIYNFPKELFDEFFLAYCYYDEDYWRDWDKTINNKVKNIVKKKIIEGIIEKFKKDYDIYSKIKEILDKRPGFNDSGSFDYIGAATHKNIWFLLKQALEKAPEYIKRSSKAGLWSMTTERKLTAEEEIEVGKLYKKFKENYRQYSAKIRKYIEGTIFNDFLPQEIYEEYSMLYFMFEMPRYWRSSSKMFNYRIKKIISKEIIKSIEDKIGKDTSLYVEVKKLSDKIFEIVRKIPIKSDSSLYPFYRIYLILEEALKGAPSSIKRSFNTGLWTMKTESKNNKVEIVGYPEGNIIKVTPEQLKELRAYGLVVWDDDPMYPNDPGQWSFNNYEGIDDEPLTDEQVIRLYLKTGLFFDDYDMFEYYNKMGKLPNDKELDEYKRSKKSGLWDFQEFNENYKDLDGNIVSREYLNDQLLMSAELGSSVESIKKWLELGADINCHDKNGNTPLLLAVIYRHFDIVKLLLECGADMFIGNYKNYPLAFAKMLRKYDNGEKIYDFLVNYVIEHHPERVTEVEEHLPEEVKEKYPELFRSKKAGLWDLKKENLKPLTYETDMKIIDKFLDIYSKEDHEFKKRIGKKLIIPPDLMDEWVMLFFIYINTETSKWWNENIPETKSNPYLIRVIRKYIKQIALSNIKEKMKDPDIIIEFKEMIKREPYNYKFKQDLMGTLWNPTKHAFNVFCAVYNKNKPDWVERSDKIGLWDLKTEGYKYEKGDIVICIDNTETNNSLTIGKEYEVIDYEVIDFHNYSNDYYVSVKDDHGIVRAYFKERFKPLEHIERSDKSGLWDLKTTFESFVNEKYNNDLINHIVDIVKKYFDKYGINFKLYQYSNKRKDGDFYSPAFDNIRDVKTFPKFLLRLSSDDIKIEDHIDTYVKYLEENIPEIEINRTIPVKDEDDKYLIGFILKPESIRASNSGLWDLKKV